MDIDVLTHCYNRFGGHATLSLVGSFLSKGAPDFGPAVIEIELHPYFRSTLPAKKTLEDIYIRHHSTMEELPKLRFLRKKQRITIEFSSEIATAEEIIKFGPPQLQLFLDFYSEVRTIIQDITNKIKSSDKFDTDKFISWLESNELALPKNEAELKQIADELELYEEEKRAAMDDWQKLGIDWIDFHPNARKILDLPFYWECANDFSPNGNDTGADVLGMYRDWRKKHKGKSSQIFFEQLLKEWNVSLNPKPSDEFSIQTHDDSAIGLAFAHLKLDSYCPEWLRDLALTAIARQEKFIRTEYSSWNLFDERMETFTLMRRKLEGSPTSGGSSQAAAP
ncbi:MAG: hypothetical protein RBR35_18195 [Salinivirgaceae bacterium]|nr:hypothetical protein [Salinivirgaceae bacterium]